MIKANSSLLYGFLCLLFILVCTSTSAADEKKILKWKVNTYGIIQDDSSYYVYDTIVDENKLDIFDSIYLKKHSVDSLIMEYNKLAKEIQSFNLGSFVITITRKVVISYLNKQLNVYHIEICKNCDFWLEDWSYSFTYAEQYGMIIKANYLTSRDLYELVSVDGVDYFELVNIVEESLY